MRQLSSNVHIIRTSVWSLVHQFSRRRAAVYATWSIAWPMTCWCGPYQIMQQSGAAKVASCWKIYINLNFFGARKLVHEFSDKGWNVKGLDNLLKKLQDSGLMTRRRGSGRRCSVRCHASLVFTRYSMNI